MGKIFIVVRLRFKPLGILVFLISSISLVGYAFLYIYARSISEGLVEHSPYFPDLGRGEVTEKAVRAKLRKIDKKEFIKYLGEEATKLKETGNELFKQDRYSEALSVFERALAIAPRSSSIWNNKAIALRALNRFEEAIVAYDQALSLDPTNDKFKVGRDSCLAEASPPDPSEDDILSVEVQEPRRVGKQVKVTMGVPVEPPRSHVRVTPAKEPAEPPKPRTYKVVKTEEVVTTPPVPASIPVEAAPMDGRRAADRKMLAGNYLDAIGLYEKLIEFDRTDVGSWNNLAFAYRQLNDHDNAERCYLETLAIRPDDPKAKKGLTKIGRA